MPITDIVSKFNQKADSHTRSQTLNPFSGQFDQSRSPSPRFSREEYGKPIAGSKTDLRGRRAKSHICREILELCTVIHDVGTYNAKKREADDDDDDDDDGSQDDGTIIVSFGELFQIYTKISDKVVGLLIAAKRRGFVYFDREILFQRRDDDVLIALLKPISEISKVLKDDINQTVTPATPVETKPAEKKKTKRVKPVENGVKQESTPAPVNGEIVAEIRVNGEKDDHLLPDSNDHNCNEDTNGVVAEEIVNNSVEISENLENEIINLADAPSSLVHEAATNGEQIDDDTIITTETVNGEIETCEGDADVQDEVEIVVQSGEHVDEVDDVGQSEELVDKVEDVVQSEELIDDVENVVQSEEHSADVEKVQDEEHIDDVEKVVQSEEHIAEVEAIENKELVDEVEEVENKELVVEAEEVENKELVDEAEKFQSEELVDEAEKFQNEKNVDGVEEVQNEKHVDDVQESSADLNQVTIDTVEKITDIINNENSYNPTENNLTLSS